ncbi:MAG: four helix bundle protein [Acidimicrobiia bacterium]|nr:four helix bundle protein [Acidimicrobiia bacterium]
MRHHKRYEVWRLAHQLVIDVYRLTDGLPAAERYGLATQMNRAAVSISSNVAEGPGRGSDADFCRFLLMANGSANELESQLLITRELRLADGEAAARLLGQVDQVRRHLIKLIKAAS